MLFTYNYLNILNTRKESGILYGYKIIKDDKKSELKKTWNKEDYVIGYIREINEEYIKIIKNKEYIIEEVISFKTEKKYKCYICIKEEEKNTTITNTYVNKYITSLEYNISSNNKIIMTSPHNIQLLRKYKNIINIHENELYTKELTKIFSDIMRCSYISWSENEIKENKCSGPSIYNEDPNFMNKEQIENSNWVKLLKIFFRSTENIHICIHGMTDSPYKPDCEIAVIGYFKEKIKNKLEDELIPMFDKYKLKLSIGGKRTKQPIYTGIWSMNDIKTLVQITSEIGYNTNIQIEMSLTFRKLLINNINICKECINIICKNINL